MELQGNENKPECMIINKRDKTANSHIIIEDLKFGNQLSLVHLGSVITNINSV